MQSYEALTNREGVDKRFRQRWGLGVREWHWMRGILKVGFDRARVSDMGVGGGEVGFGRRVGFRWCMT